MNPVFCNLPLRIQLMIWTALTMIADLIHLWPCGTVPHLP